MFVFIWYTDIKVFNGIAKKHIEDEFQMSLYAASYVITQIGIFFAELSITNYSCKKCQ